jgi:nucleotide-binding universal stress UspA family protein
MRMILVPVADRPECAHALRTAFDLGNRLGATVHGCHMRRHRQTNNSRAPARAKALFEKIAGQNGYDGKRRPGKKPCAWWSERVASPELLMSIVGPVSDLIVVSHPVKTGGIADEFMKSALVRAGRPVLILPQRGRKVIGKRIVIAWDQGVLASMAVSPAIPLLQLADEVTIVNCGPEDKPGPKASQLASYLKAWNVTVKHVRTRGRNVEKELLAEYRKANADLLIGGAYSRARWKQRVFGGTTDFLIHKARIPVLLREA